MLGIIIGYISILIGFFVLLLPLLIAELSRSRDGIWGALLMIFGIVMITDYDRFLGSPMLGVVSVSFLIGRLGLEVFQSRWYFLTQEEKIGLTSLDRWNKRLKEFFSVFVQLISVLGGLLKVFNRKDRQNLIKKKWIREDNPETSSDTDNNPGEIDNQQLLKVKKEGSSSQEDPQLEIMKASKDP
tara:strand:+ start:70 stop:624 length:555 start_codon:yes stop_codon:yes gene_type:complete